MAVFSNKANLKYNGKSIDSNTVYGNMPSSALLTKHHVESDYASGSTITYIINIVNISDAALTDISLVTIMFYLDGIMQPAPPLSSDGELTVNNLTIPSGSVATIIYQTTVAVLTPVSITNTVTLSGDGLPSEISASDTIQIGKTCSKRSLTYSITDIPYPDIGSQK